MNTIGKLQYAKNYIDSAMTDMEEAPEKSTISELLTAIETIDDFYKGFCAEKDQDADEDEGTAYEHGVSEEFYIEAEDWHDVSMALRKLKDIENG